MLNYTNNVGRSYDPTLLECQQDCVRDALSRVCLKNKNSLIYTGYIFREQITEAATRRYSVKKVFLEISQN